MKPAPRGSPAFRGLKSFAALLAGGGALLVFSVSSHAAIDDEIAAVCSRTSDDYLRAKLPDGTFQTETYAFGRGGYWGGGLPDQSIDAVDFRAVANVIVGPLARQNYLSTRDAPTTKLLIMVYWGMTNPPQRAKASAAYANEPDSFSAFLQAKAAGDPADVVAALDNAYSSAAAGPQAQAHLNRQIDLQNARMLGYDSWWQSTARLEGTAFHVRRQDLINELEEERYFVVLMAYDFQLMWKQKKAKLLWETRFSLGEHHHEFNRDLPAMTRYASKFFGQDTHGLVRKPLAEVRVELGDLKSLGAEPEKK